MKNAIPEFQGEYRFLSKFWPAQVELYGVIYPSVEHAYVAGKTMDLSLRRRIAACTTPGEAKRLGRALTLRADWDEIKLDLMLHLVREKFKHPDLAEKLKNTGNVELIEGNHWNDTFWGVCRGKGQNHLGKILMKVRSEL